MSNAAIRVAVGQFNELTEEKLRFAAQIGVKGIQMNNPKLPGETRWEAEDIGALVDKAAAAGLVLEAIENVPTHFYHKAMLGLPGRDEQIENYLGTVRNIGLAGVPILGLHFMPNSVWRTQRRAPGRGGAGNTRFDMAAVEASGKEEWRRFMPTTLGRQETMPLSDDTEGIVTAEKMWQLRPGRDHGFVEAQRLHRLPARRSRAAHGRRHGLEPSRPRPRHRLHARPAPHGSIGVLYAWL